MQDSLLASLRSATAEQHALIERRFQLAPPLALDTYVLALQALEFFLREWEPRAEAALPPSRREWFRSRRRGALARDDLDTLGHDVRAGRALVPALDSVSSALGSMYVVEGSALGGQVIAKHVHSAYGLDGGTGASYFIGWGGRTGPMWREFQQVLADHDGAGADHGAACAAAVETFAAMGRAHEWASQVPTTTRRYGGTQGAMHAG